MVTSLGQPARGDGPVMDHRPSRRLSPAVADAPELSRRGFLRGARWPAAGSPPSASQRAPRPSPRRPGRTARRAAPAASGSAAPAPSASPSDAHGSHAPGASAPPGATPARRPRRQRQRPSSSASSTARARRCRAWATSPWTPTIDGDTKVFELTVDAIKHQIDAQGPASTRSASTARGRARAFDVTEGDKVRAIFTNNLDESTGIHFHGQRLPNAMDGVPARHPGPDPAGRLASPTSSRRKTTGLAHVPLAPQRHRPGRARPARARSSSSRRTRRSATTQRTARRRTSSGSATTRSAASRSTAAASRRPRRSSRSSARRS